MSSVSCLSSVTELQLEYCLCYSLISGEVVIKYHLFHGHQCTVPKYVHDLNTACVDRGLQNRNSGEAVSQYHLFQKPDFGKLIG